MLVKILIGLAVVILLLIVVIATRPADFRIVRSISIAAPPSAVFPQVNSFHKWRGWSPWEDIDPDLKRTYEGPEAGKDAHYAWVGNSKVGEGRMTIMESRHSDLIRIKLEFLKPFKATNTAEFTFKPEGDQTIVTWNMAGHNNFVCKGFSLLMNMDKMIGGQFEKGLSTMKSVVENGK